MPLEAMYVKMLLHQGFSRCIPVRTFTRSKALGVA